MFIADFCTNSEPPVLKAPVGQTQTLMKINQTLLLKGILYKQMQVRCCGEASASLPSDRDPETPPPPRPLPSTSRTASLSVLCERLSRLFGLHLAHVEHFKGGLTCQSDLRSERLCLCGGVCAAYICETPILGHPVGTDGMQMGLLAPFYPLLAP